MREDLQPSLIAWAANPTENAFMDEINRNILKLAVDCNSISDIYNAHL